MSCSRHLSFGQLLVIPTKSILIITLLTGCTNSVGLIIRQQAVRWQHWDENVLFCSCLVKGAHAKTSPATPRTISVDEENDGPH